MIISIGKKLRFKLAEHINKRLIPNFYRINLKPYFDKELEPELKYGNNHYRPAIQEIKNHYEGKFMLLNGAEIGVEFGNNAEYILKTLPIFKLFLVDIWEQYQDHNVRYDNEKAYWIVCDKFKDNPKVKIMKMFSEIASKHIPDNSLDFVYIDACHDYESVKQDIELWSKKVHNYGIVAGHDFNLLSVKNAVFEYCNKHKMQYFTKPNDWWFFK